MAIHWRRVFGLSSERDGYGYREEIRRLLPSHRQDDVTPAFDPKEVTKVALRLKYLIEEVIPYELEEDKITKANSQVITRKVMLAAKEAGGKEHASCVVYCLLVCKRWFKRQAILELWDAEMHNVRATACEVIAKLLIESEDDQDYLFQDVLLKRYSIIRSGEETKPANVVERSVDLHALRVIGSSGYQKCISYLWRGWLIQDDRDPAGFIAYDHRDSTDFWVHFHPDRMRAPVYQNAVQIFFSLLYLSLYSQVINTINTTGNIDVVEGILYLFTLGFICDELAKFWKVGRYYIGFWNVFNSTLYALLSISFITRMIALSKNPNPEKDGDRHRFNELSYNFLAFSAPMFWMRLLLYLDSFRFFGAMLVVLKVMMQESLIFFALLAVVMVGFLQAFIGMDNVDTNKEATSFIIQAMLNSVMGSPDFGEFQNFAPPFGITLYYIFTFIVLVVLLNILIALYNSAYADITDNAIDEYMALFSQKTMQFVRAPDENVFIAPLNLLEITLLILPLEWWLPRHQYSRLNDAFMLVLYSPLLLITAFLERKEAVNVRWNRRRGESDDDTVEEWEEMRAEEWDRQAGGGRDGEGWKKVVESVKPDVATSAAVVEVRHLRQDMVELKALVEGLKREEAERKGGEKGEGEDGSSTT